MNDEMKYFAEELEEFLRKGHKMLNKMQQRMGQRGGGYYPGQVNYPNGQMHNGDGTMGERNWIGNGFDPRFM